MLQPERGQRWRFADGREGAVASANALSVVVYIGPQAFTVPRGDVDVVFADAVLAGEDKPADAPTRLEVLVERLAAAVERLAAGPVAGATPPPPAQRDPARPTEVPVPAPAAEEVAVHAEPEAPAPVVAEARPQPQGKRSRADRRQGHR